MGGEVHVRLASVVCVDVVGYSAQTEADAAAAASEVLRLRERLDQAAARHGGRIFSTGGDSVLMEFPAARQALAVICDLIDQRPPGAPDVRVGAHVGDVAVAANGDLLGHGVNVAARLAATAQPGRAVISRELKEASVGAIRRDMHSLGELTLAKMQTRIEGFEISPAGGAPASAPAPNSPSVNAISIAVLPFADISVDPQQEYLSDGLTEDIIIDLSRWRTLAVSSRNSTFRYKGKSVDAMAAGRELGVRFLVEGSIRRMGDRVRITVQLVDAESGRHVWAERYDRAASDVFDVQDEVVSTIVGTLAGRVHATEADRVRRKPPSSLAAYELTLRGNWLNWNDPATNKEAREAFEQAIRLDPDYGLPHSLLATMLRLAWVDDLAAPDELLDRALHLARRGVELAEGENASQMALAYVHLYRREFDSVEDRIDRALRLNPANPRNQAEYGMIMPFLGAPDVGLKYLRGARRADPYFGPHWYWHSLGVAQFTLKDYAGALSDFERSGTAKPRTIALMAACRAKLGQADLASELLASTGGANIRALARRLPFREESGRAHLVECLSLAGLPD